MTNKTYKLGMASFRIEKESGRLSVKDGKGGSHKPVMFGAYYDHSEPLDLRTYMNLTGKTLAEATNTLDSDGVVLVGNRFDICFYGEESVEKFLDSLGLL